MRPVRNISPTRGGFLLLMLIAFTSIILGLATTFYVYCQRGLDNSQVSVRLAQQRLALNAAMAYVVGRAVGFSSPSSTVLSPSGSAQSLFVLQDPTIARTKSLGWFRVAAADAAYVGANFTTGPYAGTVAANCAFITAGVGSLAGQQIVSDTNPNSVWNDTRQWGNELRSWYLVELDPAPIAPATAIKRFVKLPGPPQTGFAGSTVFYW